MSKLRWCIALFGIFFGLMISALVSWDIYLYTHDIKTISEWVSEQSQHNPILAVIVSGPFFFLSGCLAGHWWFPLDRVNK